MKAKSLYDIASEGNTSGEIDYDKILNPLPTKGDISRFCKELDLARGADRKLSKEIEKLSSKALKDFWRIIGKRRKARRKKQ